MGMSPPREGKVGIQLPKAKELESLIINRIIENKLYLLCLLFIIFLPSCFRYLLVQLQYELLA